MTWFANDLLGVLIVLGLIASALVAALLVAVFCAGLFLVAVLGVVRIARRDDVQEVVSKVRDMVS
jgi:hypothetical protein